MHASTPQTVLRYTCLLSTATFECYTDRDLSRPLHQQKIQYAEDYGGGLQRRFNTQGSYSFRQFKFNIFLMPLGMKLKTNFTITKIEEKNNIILIFAPTADMQIKLFGFRGLLSLSKQVPVSVRNEPIRDVGG